jgi:hypothetical protein
MFDAFEGDEWLTNPDHEGDKNGRGTWDEDNYPKHTGVEIRQRAYEILVQYHEDSGSTFDDAALWKPAGSVPFGSADDFQ